MATMRLTDPGNYGRMRAFQDTQPTETSVLELRELTERAKQLADFTQWLDHLEWRMKRYRQEWAEDDLWMTPSVARISRVGGDLRDRLARMQDEMRRRISR